MEWKSEFSVQVPGIDRDHQILAEHVTEIEQAVGRGESGSGVTSAISQFIALARAHFNHEVALMRIHDYPDIDAHIQAHKQFLASLKALEDRSLAETLSGEAVAFLPRWLEEHMSSYDKDYASYFARTGKAGKPE